MKTELNPIKDTRKSFYGKALVETNENSGVVTLYSYNTPVCKWYGERYVINTNVDKDLLFSQTTLRHIKEFLYQYAGFDTLTKKEIIKYNEPRLLEIAFSTK